MPPPPPTSQFISSYGGCAAVFFYIHFRQASRWGVEDSIGGVGWRGWPSSSPSLPSLAIDSCRFTYGSGWFWGTEEAGGEFDPEEGGEVYIPLCCCGFHCWHHFPYRGRHLLSLFLANTGTLPMPSFVYMYVWTINHAYKLPYLCVYMWMTFCIYACLSTIPCVFCGLKHILSMHVFMDACMSRCIYVMDVYAYVYMHLCMCIDRCVHMLVCL